jgi:hypothetical protein
MLDEQQLFVRVGVGTRAGRVESLGGVGFSRWGHL